MEINRCQTKLFLVKKFTKKTSQNKTPKVHETLVLLKRVVRKIRIFFQRRLFCLGGDKHHYKRNTSDWCEEKRVRGHTGRGKNSALNQQFLFAETFNGLNNYYPHFSSLCIYSSFPSSAGNDESTAIEVSVSRHSPSRTRKLACIHRLENYIRVWSVTIG